MSDKIVSINGTAPPVPKVNADVVERLEALLAQARDGMMTGFVYGLVEPNADIKTGWTGNASQHSMIAATAILHHRALTELMIVG